MLARIRNGQLAKLSSITCPASRLLENVASVLKQEGYIVDFSRERPADASFDQLKIELKYHEGEPVIKEMKKVSKPGRRLYYSLTDLHKQKAYSGLGIFIISTSKGVLSDHDARAQQVGGEILCAVF